MWRGRGKGQFRAARNTHVEYRKHVILKILKFIISNFKLTRMVFRKLSLLFLVALYGSRIVSKLLDRGQAYSKLRIIN